VNTSYERQMGKELSDSLVRWHLESLTPGQFQRVCEIAQQIATGTLRRVTLSDGSGVLVDGDCTVDGGQ
jgi:hypothetical protein